MIVRQQSIYDPMAWRLICTLCGKKTIEMTRESINGTFGQHSLTRCGCEEEGVIKETSDD